MWSKEDYGKTIEHFASRNFNEEDRVKVFFKGEWFHGTVIKKYIKSERGPPPYILIRTDKIVDDESNAFLDGFGLEGRMGGPDIIFEHEPSEGDEIYTRTYLREKTDEEKKADEEIPF